MRMRIRNIDGFLHEWIGQFDTWEEWISALSRLLVALPLFCMFCLALTAYHIWPLREWAISLLSMVSCYWTSSAALFFIVGYTERYEKLLRSAFTNLLIGIFLFFMFIIISIIRNEL